MDRPDAPRPDRVVHPWPTARARAAGALRAASPSGLRDRDRHARRSRDQAHRAEYARFFNRVAYDNGFEGKANTDEEGERLVRVARQQVGDDDGQPRRARRRLHGRRSLRCMYYLERACQTQVLAYSTGKPLNVMADAVAERTAQDWEEYADSAFTHFDEMKKVLDSIDPSYAD